MVLYQFQCIMCGHEFEVMQRMDKANPECPKCQGEARKQIGASTFKLKGGGWASEGYQKK